MNTRNSTVYYVALMLAVFIWSTAFVGIRYTLQDFSPGALALFRYISASICMLVIYALFPKKKRPSLLELAALLGIGVIGFAFYNVTLNHGEKTVPAALASFIIAQTPVFVSVLAVFFKEKIRCWGIVGFSISIIGVTIIFLSEEHHGGFDMGLVYLLGTLVANVIYIILQRPLLKRFHAIEVIAYASWGATLALSIYTPDLVREIKVASEPSIYAVIYMGIFPGALGYALWAYGYSALSVARASSFLYLLPFITLILGWVWLSEMPPKMALCGGLVAMFGAYIIGKASKNA